VSASTYLVGVRINGDASGLARAAQEGMRSQRLLGDAAFANRSALRVRAARERGARPLGVRAEREIRARSRARARPTPTWRDRARCPGKSSAWPRARCARKSRKLTNEMGR
jgi:hypothetical protein